MIPLKDRRILLVGGAGFIGHNLALALAKEGAKVHVVDSLQVNNLLNFAATSGDNVPHRNLYFRIIQQRLELLQEAGIPLEILDARDYHALSHLVTRVKPQAVVHL